MNYTKLYAFVLCSLALLSAARPTPAAVAGVELSNSDLKGIADLASGGSDAR
jgi:hypothetical protein